MTRIPEKYRDEYFSRLDVLFKARTLLFVAIGTGIYVGVSSLYLFRFFTGHDRHIFRFEELYAWAALLIFSFVISLLCIRTHKRRRFKLYAHAYNIFLQLMIAVLCTLYPENATVFAFYFAMAHMVVALTVPWPPRDIYFLSLVPVAAHTLLFLYLTQVMKVPIVAFPRFHPYFDGMKYIMIGVVIAIILGRKRAERDIENFMLLKSIEEKNVQTRKDLEFARLIQRTLVPESLKTGKTEIVVTYRPVSYVGGDYARFRFVTEDYLLFIISDVTGHGVAAALLVNRIHAEFERLAKEEKSPAAIVKKLDDFIRYDFGDSGKYLSAFCGAVDFKRSELTYSNCGHPPQYLCSGPNPGLTKLASQSALLGFESGCTFREQKVYFGKGDRLVLYTDGILEAKNMEGELFGNKRFEDYLIRSYSVRPHSFHAGLLEELRRHNPDGVRDDIFLLSFEL